MHYHVALVAPAPSTDIRCTGSARFETPEQAKAEILYYRSFDLQFEALFGVEYIALECSRPVCG